MDRFIKRGILGTLIPDCVNCSRYGSCHYASDCIDELIERLYQYEEETEKLNKQLRSNPIISKLMDKMKG